MATESKAETNSASEMELDDLNLRVGHSIQIKTEDRDSRYAVKLIGFLARRSLIVTSPLVKSRHVAIRPGQKILARMILNDIACAFTSTVIHVRRTPYPYLHLSYPKDLVANAIRDSIRVETDVPVSVVNTSTGERARELSGWLIDMSETGARLVTPQRIGKKGDEIRLKMFLDIRGIDRAVETEAVLRGRLKPRIKKDESEVHYGVEFAPMNEEERIALIAFVYSIACELP